MTEQVRTKQERHVGILLRIMGAVLVSAFLPMLFPRSWMMSLYEQTGLTDWSEQPISWYFARSLSLMYFAHGALVLALSTNVKGYWPLIKLLAWLNLLIGTSLTLIDITSGMPLWWTALEGPSVIAGGVLLLWLMRKS